MIGEHPIKQLLSDTQEYWDHKGTPAHVREAFWRIIHCGTIALGAEVYASKIQCKLVFHTCKSRFCTSCGQRATEAWQSDLEAVLPDIPYVGITLTMPMEFRTILQQNRHVLHGIPTIGAGAIQQWAKARGKGALRSAADCHCGTADLRWPAQLRTSPPCHGLSRWSAGMHCALGSSSRVRPTGANARLALCGRVLFVTGISKGRP